MLRIISLCAVLSACSVVDPGIVADLARLDPLSAEPSDFAARLLLPEGLDVPPGGAVLTASATRSDTGEAISGRHTFEATGEIWRLSEADAAALRRFQAQVAVWKAEAPDATSGQIALDISACHIGNGPAPDAVVSADLSLDGGQSFTPFIRSVPVTDIVPDSAGEDGGAGCPFGN